jgi:hypothetical protein
MMAHACGPSYLEGRGRRSVVQGCQGKCVRPHLKNKQKVKGLALEALSSIPSTAIIIIII